MTNLPRIVPGRSTAAAAIVLAAMSSAASARGVSPYLPLRMSPEIERDIERVLIFADKPVMVRPIPAATVLDALPKACEVEPVLCERVRRYLGGYMRGVLLTHATLEGAVTRDVTRTVPNQYGMMTDSPWMAAVGGFVQPSDYALVNLGGVAYDGNAVASGSFLSLGFEYAQLDVGYRDRWFSPFTDSSMLISTQAPAMPSITLSNYTPITDLGIHYQVFLAEMSHSDRIAIDDRFTSGEPRLLGMHLAIEPVSGWSLAANRLMQFGGGERSGQSAGDVFDAFFRPAEVDNFNANPQEEFGNQAASFTSSFVFPGKTPFAVYFEYAGEDSSNSESFILGNAALSVGVHFPRLWGNMDLTYEASDWQNSWYVSDIYLDGLSNDGHVLGHWAGEDRQQGDAVGGQSHMIKVGWDLDDGSLLELRYRTLANESYSPVDYQRLHDVTFGYSRAWRPYYVGAQLQFGRDVFGEDFGRLSAFVRYAGGRGPLPSEVPGEAKATDDSGDIFVDVGINAGKVRQDILDSADVVWTGVSVTPHLGIGVRRAVSKRTDLGARLELDEFDGESFLAVRALDYRYRFADSWALGAFLGAARYDLGTAAYGYYMGIGAQYRDLAPRWDLSLDLRYGHKVARDRVLPGEPVFRRTDSFFDVVGASLYLSRRL